MHAHVTLHGPPNTRHTASARRKGEPVRRAKLPLLCARPQPLTPTRCNIYTTQHGAASPWPAQERARSIRNALRCPTRAFACLARVARRRMGASKKVSNYSIASRNGGLWVAATLQPSHNFTPTLNSSLARVPTARGCEALPCGGHMVREQGTKEGLELGSPLPTARNLLIFELNLF